MNGTLRIWLIGIVVMVGVGAPLQLLFWWHGSRSAMAALAEFPALWGLYLLAGVLVGEHLRRARMPWDRGDASDSR